MVLVIDDAGKEFGKTIGGQAALALSVWLQRLWDAEGVARKEQLESFVEPSFKMFQEIYKEYERSFRGYRKELTDAESEQDIYRVVEKIEGDLRFTVKDRIDLMNHLNHSSNSIFEGFVRSIVEFLVSNEESRSGSAEDASVPQEIRSQVVRRGLIADLKAVMTAPWAAALGLGAFAPPIQDIELERKLDAMGTQYGIEKQDPNREGKLRARLAVKSLDSRTESMAAAYKKVREEYEILKTNLLIS